MIVTCQPVDFNGQVLTMSGHHGYSSIFQANIKNHELGFNMKVPVVQSHTRQLSQSHTSLTYKLSSTQMSHQLLGQKCSIK